MWRQRSIYQYVQVALVASCPILGWVSVGHGQALHEERLSNGTQVLVVAEPLAGGASAAWLLDPAQEEPSSVAGGELTFLAELDHALRGPEQVAPAVVAVVGVTPVRDLRRTLEQALAGRPVSPRTAPPPSVPDEGGLERRLGAPGSQARLSLVLPLPWADDFRRPSLDVLAEILPPLLAAEAPGLRTRSSGSELVLELDVEAELADLKLRRLRLGLARVGSANALDDQVVEAARQRLEVRRRAQLEQHPEGAEELVRLWVRGGAAAVRQHLFGLSGVTAETVAAAARQWLPAHPGAASVILPPVVFHPRFAAAPRRVVAAGDLSVVVLERPGSPLGAVCLRPLVLPDLDGGLSATVLARLAAAIRADPHAPGWVRVERGPARLELADSPEALPELLESLQHSLAGLADDPRAVEQDGSDPRRTALRLMAVHLGVSDDGSVTPPDLLSRGNLAVGMVVVDGEAAVEALEKLLGERAAGPGVVDSHTPGGAGRTRAAQPGPRSALAVSLPLPEELGAAEVEVLRALLLARGRAALPEAEVDVLRPLVPGRSSLVLTVTLACDLDALERRMVSAWPGWTGAIGEEELERRRREVAAAVAISSGGALGLACRCAELAASADAWSEPAAAEMEVLSSTGERLDPALDRWRDWDGLIVTGAGPLPVGALPIPSS